MAVALSGRMSILCASPLLQLSGEEHNLTSSLSAGRCPCGSFRSLLSIHHITTSCRPALPLPFPMCPHGTQGGGATRGRERREGGPVLKEVLYSAWGHRRIKCGVPWLWGSTRSLGEPNCSPTAWSPSVRTLPNGMESWWLPTQRCSSSVQASLAPAITRDLGSRMGTPGCYCSPVLVGWGPDQVSTIADLLLALSSHLPQATTGCC